MTLPEAELSFFFRGRGAARARPPSGLRRNVMRPFERVSKRAV